MENNIKLTVELSESDKALFGKLLAAVEALNTSLFGKLLTAVEALNTSLWYNEFKAAKSYREPCNGKKSTSRLREKEYL